MTRDAILEMQQRNGVRTLVFDRIIEGPPPCFKKKISSKKQEVKEMISNCFEYSFEDSLEAIYGVIWILPAEYAEDDQNRHILRDYVKEDYFDDPCLRPKVVWVTQVSSFTLHQNATVFDPPSDDMSYHMKSLHLTAMVEDQVINKILVDGGDAFNILPRSMLWRLGRNAEDSISHNIVVSYFCGKSLDSRGVICLDVSIGSRRRPTMLLVISLLTNFNMLLGRKWMEQEQFH